MYIAAVALCILYCLQGFESDCRPLMHMYTGQKVQSIDWVPDSSVNSEECSVVLPQGACNRQRTKQYRVIYRGVLSKMYEMKNARWCLSQ